jgi:hypothetical protein
MAGANLPAKKYKKTSPTVLRLSFEGAGGTTRYIDIARALSIINRKFYRQGVYYYVNSVELYNNSDHYVDLHTLPDTWVTKNAWNRGFKIYQEMTSLVDTPRPKYHDFKVRMSYGHTEAATMDPELFDINGAYSSKAPNEWEFSKFTDMHSDGGAADNFTVHMIGEDQGVQGNWDSIGLIRSYALSRGYAPLTGEPQLRTGHQSDVLSNLFDASGDNAEEQIMLNLDSMNDETPYDTFYHGENNAGAMQHVARLATTTTVGRVAKASGFCAPFGLICVDPANTTSGDDTWRIVINLAAGTYHGVYAERA